MAGVLNVDGQPHAVELQGRELLSDTLRKVGCYSVHVGCEHGYCGACTILVSGRAVRACLMLTATVLDDEITTLQGLPEDLGETIRRAFSDNYAAQCGFCTPGFMMLCADAMLDGKSISRDDLDEAVSSNLCRCTGYEPIINAFADACAAENAARSVDGSTHQQGHWANGTSKR